MSARGSRSVDPFVLGLAILGDDGDVLWANAPWQNLAESGTRLSPVSQNQLQRCRTGAEAGDPHAENFVAELTLLLSRERLDFALDCPDRDDEGVERWLALYALRAHDDHVVLVCSADLVDHDSAYASGGSARTAAGAWEWDRASGTLSCSAPLLQTLGLTAENAPRDIVAASELVVEDGRARAVRAAASALLSGNFDSDIPIGVPGFRPRYFRVHGEATAWRGGRPQRLIGFAWDVTDIRSGEDRLEELARYSDIVADLGRAALSNVDTDTLLASACSAAVDGLRFAGIRVVFSDPAGALAVRSECTLDADGDLSAHDAYIRRAIEEQEAQVAPDVEGMWRSGVAAPIRGESLALHAYAVEPSRFGDTEASFIRALANVLSAALERRRYELELIEARLEMTALVEHSPDAIIRFDSDLRIRYANPALRRLTNSTPEQFIGLRMGECAPGLEEITDVWEAGLRTVLDTGTEQEFEARGPISHRIFLVRCVPEPAADGTVRYLLAVCRDVTEKRRDEEEKRRLEQQLDQASRLTSLGRLAATIAHEFNNVLMAIQPFADLLQRHAVTISDTAVDGAAVHIAQAVLRGRRITQEMLRYTRAVEPVRESVDVGELLTYVCNTMTLVVADRLRITLELPDAPVYLYADRTQLEQVFTNLIANARDAVGPGGSLTISANAPAPDATYPFGVIPRVEEYLHLTFRDDGSGIPPDLLEHIFEPLFTSKRDGTGVGLAVAHQVVSTHGGHLFVESRQGAGTAFHLFLPRAQGAPGAVVHASARAEVQLQRIALVEDEPAIAEGLIAVLQSEGFDVEHVATGGAAEQLIETFAPQLVLLDVGLPDIDGVEVYQRIRSRWPDLPVIFSTGHGDRRKVEEVAQERHVSLLMKPYELEELFEAIAALERRAAG
jgi:PAS domain S-box-containing protein